VVLAAAGVLLVCLVLFDLLVTTLSASTRAGPLTTGLTNGLWRLAIRGIPDGRHRHKLLGQLGMPIVALIIAQWALLLWAGWTLVFNATDTAVISSTSRMPATIEQRVYYAGNTMTALATSGFEASGTFFQLATVVASTAGYFVITLAVTYLVPVVSAVETRRQLASQIHGLGDTPERLVTQAWTGESFPTSFAVQLVSLTATISLQSQRHLAYPVLRVFHSPRRQTAAGPAVAVLAEAVTLLRYGVATSARPPSGVLLSLFSAIAEYCQAVPLDVPPPAEAPTPPSLAPLRTAGIPTVTDEQFADSLSSCQDHRRRVAAQVNSDGWAWSAVTTG
jgi:hypothetical protein